MILHGLAGLPRSGSTMLASILEQHPDVHIDTASVLSYCIGAVQHTITTEPEVVVDLNDPANRRRYADAYRGLIAGWHANVDKPVVIDKGRAWVLWPLLLRFLEPESRVIVCVRDPRDVVASVERAHRASPEFASGLGETFEQRVATLMDPQGGKVGLPCRGIEDLIRSGTEVVWARYETVVVQPRESVDSIARHLGLEPFHFDLDGLDREEPAQDAQWRYKFPHTVAGPVKDLGKHWSTVIPDDIAARIAATFPLFMQTFGYTDPGGSR